ncbi:MAG: hypothetical protein HZA46_14175 [Planctomycetales bacterium]|nr:hypothetical protein [Planctomycetales bacterium]
MNRARSGLCVVLGLLVGVMWLAGTLPADSPKGAADLLKNVQTGNPGLKSVGTISFGPQGLLLVADPQSAGFVAIQTGDLGPVVKLKKKVNDVRGLVGSAMGAPPDGIDIADMTVNPLSGKIYLAVTRKTDRQAAILTIDADGKVADLALANVKYVRVSFPEADRAKLRNITDLEVASDRVILAGQSNEEFASRVYSVPFPLTHDGSGKMLSTETYHVAHGKWETRAPIQSFVPYEENGQSFVVGAFACTPIAKFPLADIKNDAQVKGTSVVELGSGNRPLDMFTYEKGGKKWLVTNTYRMHFAKNLFGPSKWWGVRVSMDYMNAQDVNEKAARRDLKEKSGPNGIEIVDSLFGAVQVAKLDNDQIVVLRADPSTDTDAILSLELAQLP